MKSLSDTLAANPTRELAAIMFSDIVGYTVIMGRDEREGLRAVREHRAQLRAVLPQFNGRLFGEIGRVCSIQPRRACLLARRQAPIEPEIELST